MDFRCSFFIKNGPFVRCRETADTAQRDIRATYQLTDHDGKKQEITQTFYLDKALTRVIAFKEN